MRTHARLFVLAATISLFGSLLITAGRVEAATTLTVTPDSGLAGGQVVQVAGTGLDPGAQAGWCEGVVTTPLSFNSCDQATINGGSAAPDGTFGGPLRLRRFIFVPAINSWVDCVASPQRCVIGAADISNLAATVATVPLTFAVPPPPPAIRGAIALSQASGLQPGQFITVSGAGFRSGAAIDLLQCVPGAGAPADPTSCAPSPQAATADASGAFSAQMQIFGTITVPPRSPTDCSAGGSGQCRVVAAEAVDVPGTAVAAGISFVGSPPVVLPGSGVVTAPVSGTADLTVSVTLDAASSTPVTVPWTTRNVPGAPVTFMGPQAPLSDYTASSGVVTFAPGQTTATVTIPVNGCTGGDVEYLVISFNHPSGARMGGFWGLGFGVIFKGT